MASLQKQIEDYSKYSRAEALLAEIWGLEFDIENLKPKIQDLKQRRSATFVELMNLEMLIEEKRNSKPATRSLQKTQEIYNKIVTECQQHESKIENLVYRLGEKNKQLQNLRQSKM